MSDKKQPETEQPRQQNKGWPWVKGIIMIALGGSSLFICWLYLSPEFICWLRLFPEQWATQKHIWLQLYLGVLAVAGVVALCKPQIITSSSEKYFITRVLVTGITGGAFALLLPIAVKSTTTGVGGLRHSILLATGGLLAILTLGETRRKNDIDKDKNDKDYRRQVRAERRERYTKAVEQLGDEKAPVRMGGVYTLVGLVDEWLEDESIEKYEDRLKEGQVIINNLCAYIRSPFALTSHYDELSKDTPKLEIISTDREQEFYIGKAALNSEADVRLSIMKEIHDRLHGSEEKTPGKWSDFEYNFSGSTFFYPVDLTKSYYKKTVKFSGSVYQDEADFRGSTYEGDADFRGSTYQDWTDFSDSFYEEDVSFSTSDLRSTYEGEAYFSNSTYKGEAYFNSSAYKKDVIFSTFNPRSSYRGKADFRDGLYRNNVFFITFTPRSSYKFYADFRGSTYEGDADFRGSTYNNVADFSGSIFYQKVYFGADGDNSSFSRFTDCAPQFYDETNHKNTLFGSHNNDFTVDNDKGYPIDLNPEGIPLKCKFLTSEQKAYLEGKFQEIEKINNKLLEVKDPKEKEELLKKLRSLNEELHKWREEATTVKVEDGAIENAES